MWIYRNLENTIHIAQIQASSHVTFKNFTTITYSANKSPSRGSRKRNIFLIVASSFRLSFAFWFYPHKQERKAMIISSVWSIFHILCSEYLRSIRMLSHSLRIIYYVVVHHAPLDRQSATSTLSFIHGERKKTWEKKSSRNCLRHTIIKHELNFSS